MNNARRTAALALVHQEKSGYANLVLAGALEKQPLQPRDKAFVTALFYGVTERLLTLDWCLARCLSKPLQKLDPEVRAALRIGLYEARYMGTPPAVAVNEAVALCRALKKASAAALVNAVLRRALEQRPEEAAFETEAERLSVLYSVGLPVVRLLQKEYPAQCEKMLAACFEPAPTALRCNTLRCTVRQLCAALEAEGVAARPGEVPGAVLARFSGSPADTKAFQKGLYHVQGQASQLAALSLGARPGETVLDLCAAPGGKTLLLAQQMEAKGRLISCDAAANRLPLIEKAVKRCGLPNVEVRHNDAAVYDPRFEGADRVLVDAPCSGLGIMAKKPDIRYKTLEGAGALHALQLKILSTSARYVKKGGRLVYSTCTVDPAENQQVVQAFLAAAPDFRLLPALCTPPGALQQENMLTLLPGLCGPDGFFIALLERRLPGKN